MALLDWEPWLELRRVLFLVASSDDRNRCCASLRECCKATQRCFLQAASPDDLTDLDQPDVCVTDQGKTELHCSQLERLFFQTGNGVLFICFDQFTAKQAESLNSLLDFTERRYQGKRVLDSVCVVGTLRREAAQAEVFASPFFERFADVVFAPSGLITAQRTTLPKLRLKEWTHSGIKLEDTTMSVLEVPHLHVIELHGREDWKTVLIGQLTLDAVGKPVALPGKLVEIVSGATDPLTVIFKNPTWQAQQELQFLLADGKFSFNGSTYTIPRKLSFGFCEGYLDDEVANNTLGKKIEWLPFSTSFVVNLANFDQLFSLTHLSDGRVVTASGLLSLHRQPSIAIHGPLSTSQWMQLFFSPGEAILALEPEAYLPDCLQKLIPPRPAPAFVPPSALPCFDPGCFRPGKTVVVTADDVDFTAANITRRKQYEVTADMQLTALIEDLTAEQTKGDERIFSLQTKAFWRDLSDGALVVLRGLESNPDLQLQLAPLFQDEPYMLISGEPRQFKGFLVVIWPTDKALWGTVGCDVARHPVGKEAELFTLAGKQCRISDVSFESCVAATCKYFSLAPFVARRRTLTYALAYTICRVSQATTKDDVDSFINNWQRALQDHTLCLLPPDPEVRAYAVILIRLVFAARSGGAQPKPLRFQEGRLRQRLLEAAEGIESYHWRIAEAFDDCTLQSFFGALDLPAGMHSLQSNSAFLQVTFLAMRHVFSSKDEPALLLFWEKLLQNHSSATNGTDLSLWAASAKSALRIEPLTAEEEVGPNVFLGNVSPLWIVNGESALEGLLGELEQTGRVQLWQAEVGADTCPNQLLGEKRWAEETKCTVFLPGVLAQWARADSSGDSSGFKVIVFYGADLASPQLWNCLRGILLPVAENAASLLVDGELCRVSTSHLIVLVQSCGSCITPHSKLPPSLTHRAQWFYRPPASPQLPASLPVEATNLLTKLYEQVQRGLPQYPFWEADLEEAALRVALFGKASEAATLQAFRDVFHGCLSPNEAAAVEACLPVAHAEIEETLPGWLDLRHRLQSDNSKSHYLLTAPTEPLARAIYGVLSVREQRLCQTYGEPASCGKRAMLIEGQSGRGKDFLLETLLRLCKYAELQPGDEIPSSTPIAQRHKFFRHINAAVGCGYDQMREALATAQRDGLILIVSEINLIPTAILEGLIGLALHTGHARSRWTKTSTHPGFFLFATVNPSDTFKGRSQIAPSLLRHFIVQRIADYSAAELSAILQFQVQSTGRELVPQDVLTRALDWHFQLVCQLEAKGKRTLPTLRKLLHLFLRARSDDVTQDWLQGALANSYALQLCVLKIGVADITTALVEGKQHTTHDPHLPTVIALVTSACQLPVNCYATQQGISISKAGRLLEDLSKDEEPRLRWRKACHTAATCLFTRLRLESNLAHATEQLRVRHGLRCHFPVLRQHWDAPAEAKISAAALCPEERTTPVDFPSICADLISQICIEGTPASQKWAPRVQDLARRIGEKKDLFTSVIHELPASLDSIAILQAAACCHSRLNRHLADFEAFEAVFLGRRCGIDKMKDVPRDALERVFRFVPRSTHSDIDLVCRRWSDLIRELFPDMRNRQSVPGVTSSSLGPARNTTKRGGDFSDDEDTGPPEAHGRDGPSARGPLPQSRLNRPDLPQLARNQAITRVNRGPTRDLESPELLLGSEPFGRRFTTTLPSESMFWEERVSDALDRTARFCVFEALSSWHRPEQHEYEGSTHLGYVTLPEPVIYTKFDKRFAVLLVPPHCFPCSVKRCRIDGTLVDDTLHKNIIRYLDGKWLVEICSGVEALNYAIRADPPRRKISSHVPERKRILDLYSDLLSHTSTNELVECSTAKPLIDNLVHVLRALPQLPALERLVSWWASQFRCTQPVDTNDTQTGTVDTISMRYFTPNHKFGTLLDAFFGLREANRLVYCQFFLMVARYIFHSRLPILIVHGCYRGAHCWLKAHVDGIWYAIDFERVAIVPVPTFTSEREEVFKGLGAGLLFEQLSQYRAVLRAALWAPSSFIAKKLTYSCTESMQLQRRFNFTTGRVNVQRMVMGKLDFFETVALEGDGAGALHHVVLLGYPDLPPQPGIARAAQLRNMIAMDFWDLLLVRGVRVTVVYQKEKDSAELVAEEIKHLQQLHSLLPILATPTRQVSKAVAAEFLGLPTIGTALFLTAPYVVELLIHATFMYAGVLESLGDAETGFPPPWMDSDADCRSGVAIVRSDGCEGLEVQCASFIALEGPPDLLVQYCRDCPNLQPQHHIMGGPSSLNLRCPKLPRRKFAAFPGVGFRNLATLIITEAAFHADDVFCVLDNQHLPMLTTLQFVSCQIADPGILDFTALDYLLSLRLSNCAGLRRIVLDKNSRLQVLTLPPSPGVESLTLPPALIRTFSAFDTNTPTASWNFSRISLPELTPWSESAVLELLELLVHAAEQRAQLRVVLRDLGDFELLSQRLPEYTLKRLVTEVVPENPGPTKLPAVTFYAKFSLDLAQMYEHIAKLLTTALECNDEEQFSLLLSIIQSATVAFESAKEEQLLEAIWSGALDVACRSACGKDTLEDSLEQIMPAVDRYCTINHNIDRLLPLIFPSSAQSRQRSVQVFCNYVNNVEAKPSTATPVPPLGCTEVHIILEEQLKSEEQAFPADLLDLVRTLPEVRYESADTQFAAIQEKFSMPLVLFHKRADGTMRPINSPLPSDTLGQLAEQNGQPLIFFAELQPIIAHSAPATIKIFFRSFDQQTERLTYIGHGVVPAYTNFGSILSNLGYTPDKFALYRQCGATLEPLPHFASPHTVGVNDGDLLLLSSTGDEVAGKFNEIYLAQTNPRGMAQLLFTYALSIRRQPQHIRSGRLRRLVALLAKVRDRRVFALNRRWRLTASLLAETLDLPDEPEELRFQDMSVDEEDMPLLGSGDAFFARSSRLIQHFQVLSDPLRVRMYSLEEQDVPQPKRQRH